KEPTEDVAVSIEDLSTARPVFPPPPTTPPVKRPPVATGTKPPPVTVTEPTPATPRLGQIFTAEQSREYTKVLEDSAARAQRNLTVIERKRLTAEQGRRVETIRAFLKQAEQARDQDLLTAVNLARRADLLAKDLVESLP